MNFFSAPRAAITSSLLFLTRRAVCHAQLERFYLLENTLAAARPGPEYTGYVLQMEDVAGKLTDIGQTLLVLQSAGLFAVDSAQASRIAARFTLAVEPLPSNERFDKYFTAACGPNAHPRFKEAMLKGAVLSAPFCPSAERVMERMKMIALLTETGSKLRTAAITAALGSAHKVVGRFESRAIILQELLSLTSVGSLRDGLVTLAIECVQKVNDEGTKRAALRRIAPFTRPGSENEKSAVGGFDGLVEMRRSLKDQANFYTEAALTPRIAGGSRAIKWLGLSKLRQWAPRGQSRAALTRLSAGAPA